MAKQLKDFLESFEFNRAALAKQRLQNLRHLGRHKVRGARIANLMRAAGLKEEEIDETDLDQLDEVLASDASSEDYIKDFVHSTDPRFEGKTKKERIKMALGAYYAKARHKDGEGLGEAFINGREYASHGLIHPEHAKSHKVGVSRDFYAHGTGDKLSGTVTHNDGKEVHIKAEKTSGGKVHKFKVDSNLPKLDEAKDTVTKDASGKVVSFKHEGDWKKTPAVHKDKFGNVIKDKNVARNLARQGMQQAMQEEYGIELTDEDADTIVEGVLGALAGGTLAALATGPVGALAGAYLGHKVQQGANAKKKAAKQQNEESELDEAAYAGLEAEDKKGLPTAMIKKSKKAVEGDTVEGWDHPHKAVRKESYDEEGNLITMPKTYQEFMEGMTATKVAPNVTRYTGGSYGNAKGARYGNTDYDNEDLEKKDDEGQEQQKRGRGRPAGSKSGARGPRIK